MLWSSSHDINPKVFYLLACLQIFVCNCVFWKNEKHSQNLSHLKMKAHSKTHFENESSFQTPFWKWKHVLHHWQSIGTCLCSRTILSRSMKLAASANAKQGYVIEMHNLGPPFICVMLCYVVYELNVMLRICSLNHKVCLISGWVNSFWKWKHISKKRNNFLKMKAHFEKKGTTFWKWKHISKKNHILKMKAHSETHYENENII